MANNYGECHVCGKEVQISRRTGLLVKHFRHSTRTPSFRERCTGSDTVYRPRKEG